MDKQNTERKMSGLKKRETRFNKIFVVLNFVCNSNIEKYHAVLFVIIFTANNTQTCCHRVSTNDGWSSLSKSPTASTI